MALPCVANVILQVLSRKVDAELAVIAVGPNVNNSIILFNKKALL
jgi:hypothetical protein